VVETSITEATADTKPVEKVEESSIKLEVDLLDEMYLLKGRSKGRKYSHVVREWRDKANQLDAALVEVKTLQDQLNKVKRLVKKLGDKEMVAAMNESLKEPEGA